MTNPFQITKPVEPDEVIDREKEDAKLRSLAEEGNNARLIAPRRYGKTSLLRRVQARLDLSGNWITVYVDLLGILTLDDFSARIERAYVAELKGPIAKWFVALRRSLKPTLTLGGGPVPASGTVDLSAAAKTALVERLDLPLKVFEKTGKRVHVVFDEFQELDTLDGNVDAVLRSVIQHRGEAASYVFAGSHLRMMEMIFTDRKRAFYGQTERVWLNPLEPEALESYVSSRFEKTGKELTAGALEGLLKLVDGHPQRSMLAAHTLWDITGIQADLEEWDAARESVMDAVDDELRTLWTDLDPAQREALSAVAYGIGPYNRGTSSSRRGSTVTSALEVLANRGILLRVADKWHVVDPLLTQWILGQRLAPA